MIGAADPGSSGGTSFVWRLGRADLEGRWGWTELADGQLYRLHSILSGFEGQSPRMLRLDDKLRDVPISDLVQAAQDRIIELEEDDAGDLQELRLGHARWRVWGFLVGSIFDLLWWDPEHSVCRELPKGMRRP